MSKFGKGLGIARRKENEESKGGIEDLQRVEFKLITNGREESVLADACMYEMREGSGDAPCLDPLHGL